LNSQNLVDSVLALRRSGATYSNIAARLNLSVGQVAGFIHRANALPKNQRMALRARTDKFNPMQFASGLTLTELAKKTGIPRTTLTDWSQGR
jgi:DNA-directed RNA polymerase specialized sigma24 family protein